MALPGRDVDFVGRKIISIGVKRGRQARVPRGASPVAGAAEVVAQASLSSGDGAGGVEGLRCVLVSSTFCTSRRVTAR